MRIGDCRLVITSYSIHYTKLYDYVDKASIVGSIGVLMDGFGFTEAMEKVGVERRLLTAGQNKGFLDPFSPQDLAQKQHAQILLEEIHQQFIDIVRKGRGGRLRITSYNVCYTKLLRFRLKELLFGATKHDEDVARE